MKKQLQKELRLSLIKDHINDLYHEMPSSKNIPLVKKCINHWELRENKLLKEIELC